MKRLGKIFAVVVVLSLLMFAAKQGAFATFTDSNWVANYVAENGTKGLIVLFSMGAAYTSVGGPRQFMALVFGFALGGVYGALLATLSALLGCMITFYFARLTFRSTLKKRFEDKLFRFERLIIHRTFLKVLMIRLLPIGSNALTNLLAGSTHVSAWKFFAGSGIGYIPQMLIFSFAGAGIGLSDSNNLLISIVLFIFASLIGGYLYKTRLRKQVAEIVSDE
ncbi:TVP38/TMEM64 family protein [uncultured Shewanella sp.]|uniref:TVP38/TMEM64 family protein n=1 Tax=uncultured Shewanella sp. TaxID=173975 RepID=UPI0026294DF4|nr:VTT domain-containing protein [uncultured Shewanella sp.]